jgi:hypothetical protein
MSGNKSTEEIREMDSDEQQEYLMQIDIFSEEEWELYKESDSDPYHLKEITRRGFTTDDEDKYLISVEHWSDGTRPDEMNTRINVVRID